MKEYKNTLPDEFTQESIGSETPEAEVLATLRLAMKEGKTLTGQCEKCLPNGDLIVRFSENVEGVVPLQEVTYKLDKKGRVHKGKAQSRVTLKIIFKVKEIVEKDGKYTIVLSRKEAVEEIRDKYKKELKKDMLIRGVVTGFQEYGAFVDVGGDVEGIILLADLARSFVHCPEDYVSVGQVVNVVVKKVDFKKGELILSRKELLPGFESVHKYFKKGEVVGGRIRTVRDNGIYVALNDSYEGMADFVPNRKFKHGDLVRVRINRIDDERRKIKLKLM